MKPVRINDRLSICEQLSTSDVSAAAASGIRVLINNRPDGEDFGQPRASEIAEAAAQAGLASTHIPVRAAEISEDTVRAFQRALADSDGQVLAFCRSGTRSLTLWTLGEVLDGRMAKDDVIPFGRERGFDLSGAVAWLGAHGH
ncbi:TIGR01244 family sulfur transferase [Daeguia caeni]|uniref:TIGR01244 family sulfur transferase n=1 Tax=Daeguia caeni TaxID=439612 RepID=A0ABV9H681_9HYPH